MKWAPKLVKGGYLTTQITQNSELKNQASHVKNRKLKQTWTKETLLRSCKWNQEELITMTS